MITMLIGKVFLDKFFLNPPDLNTTNFVKDMFIIPTEDIHKK